MAEERLQKILARAGVASRRKAEDLITAGRVRVDGQVISELGAKVNPKRASIELDGKKLEPEQLCYGILHKPRQMLTTLSDPEGRPTAYDILRQVGVRVVPVGRLDFNTSGALLFTNDGDFAHALSHAKVSAPKVYAAKVQRPVDEKALERWTHSIDIEGKKTRPAKARVLRREDDKTWVEVTLKEGKKHQVRELGQYAGTPVVRLARLSHAGINTEGLRPGEWRLLSIDELKSLKNSYGVPQKLRGILEVKPQGGRTKDTGVRGRPSSKKPSWSTTKPKKKARTKSPLGPRDVENSERSGRSPEGRGRSPEGRGRSSEGRERSPEGRGRSPEGRGRSSEGREGRPSAGRGRSTAGRGRSTEGREGRSPEGRGRRATNTSPAPRGVRAERPGSASSRRPQKQR